MTVKIYVEQRGVVRERYPHKRRTSISETNQLKIVFTHSGQYSSSIPHRSTIENEIGTEIHELNLDISLKYWEKAIAEAVCEDHPNAVVLIHLCE